MFDEVEGLFSEVEKWGGKVMVVVVGEEGGGVKGERMEVCGVGDMGRGCMREVGVGVKLLGMKGGDEGGGIVMEEGRRLVGMWDVVVGVVDGKILREENVEWKKVRSGLGERGGVWEK